MTSVPFWRIVSITCQSLANARWSSARSDPTEYLPLCSEVVFGLEANNETGADTASIRYHTLELFGSVAQRRTSDQGRRQWAETVMNAGGPIWAMDWCPTRSADHPHPQFAAVSAHASPSETHVLGKRCVTSCNSISRR
jgi:hypothetical protein